MSCLNIEFPANSPTIDTMISILHKTIENSWKINIDFSEIEAWQKNFTGKVYSMDDERRLALWLLCNFTFYSIEDVNHLCKILYKKFIHDLAVRNKFTTQQEIEEELKKVCFSSIGSASESGGLLLYHFRQEANLSLDRFFYPTSFTSSKDNTLVFIDDATLSGGTGLRNFYNQLSSVPNKHIYYLTIIASEEAVKRLNEKGITVLYCSLVDDRHKCFTENSMTFHMFSELREYTMKIADTYGKAIVEPPTESLGYKNGQYNFGFYYNTPNNTLPIFWSNKNWTPIFSRKEKLQNAKQLHFIASRYI